VNSPGVRLLITEFVDSGAHRLGIQKPGTTLSHGSLDSCNDVRINTTWAHVNQMKLYIDIVMLLEQVSCLCTGSGHLYTNRRQPWRIFESVDVSVDVSRTLQRRAIHW
jgi:hypothetical protein